MGAGEVGSAPETPQELEARLKATVELAEQTTEQRRTEAAIREINEARRRQREIKRRQFNALTLEEREQHDQEAEQRRQEELQKSKFVAMNLRGFPRCCVENWQEGERNPVRGESLRCQTAYSIMETPNPKYEAGNRYITGFTPCIRCADKILAGAPKTSIVKRPWPLEMHQMEFNANHKKYLMELMDLLETHDVPENWKDYACHKLIHIRGKLRMIELDGCWRAYRDLLLKNDLNPTDLREAPGLVNNSGN